MPTVYFAMGLPFVALSTVSVLMFSFSDMNISNTQIAFWTSLIMLPWTLKPLWSPLLEIFKTKKFFVVATQPGKCHCFCAYRVVVAFARVFHLRNCLNGRCCL